MTSVIQTFCGVMSYSTAACNPLRTVFSDIVFRSLVARIESMMATNDVSASEETMYRLCVSNEVCRSDNELLTSHDNLQVKDYIGLGIKAERKLVACDINSMSECFL